MRHLPNGVAEMLSPSMIYNRSGNIQPPIVDKLTYSCPSTEDSLWCKSDSASFRRFLKSRQTSSFSFDKWISSTL